MAFWLSRRDAIAASRDAGDGLTTKVVAMVVNDLVTAHGALVFGQKTGGIARSARRV